MQTGFLLYNNIRKQTGLHPLRRSPLLQKGSEAMKIKLMISDQRYSSIASELLSKGFEIDDSADLILTENNYYPAHIIGRKNDEIFRLPVKDISHIESFSHDVIAHSGGEEYRVNECLRRMSELLSPSDFIRISNSVIVSMNHIKSIKPALSQKFVLTLTDGSRVDVTRTYYYIFREAFGI